MAYGAKYQLPFTNNLGEDYLIQFNLKSYEGDVVILQGKDETLTVRSLNNDDDRFNPVNSKECIISALITSQNLGIADFLATEDDQWNVRVYRETTEPPIFDGFLLVEDSAEPLLDPPIALTLRASDGLPLLKNVPLKKSDGSVFIGYNSFVDYIGHILYYINPDIHFKIYFDIYHESMNINECSLEQCGVSARTFEKDETSFRDAYSVLEEIMRSLECRIYYENGFWQVQSVWQYQKDNGYNWTEYTVTANVVTKVASAQNEFHVAGIGKDQNQFLVNKDAIRYYKVASKSVKLNYNYDIPRELVNNQFFKNGIRLLGLSTADQNGYSLPGWIHQIDRINPGPPNPLNLAYARKEIDAFAYEKDYYVVLPNETSGPLSAHLLSSLIPVDADDYFAFSLQTRARGGYTSSNPSVQAIYAILRGIDGTIWEASVGIPPSGSNVVPWIWKQAPDIDHIGGIVRSESDQTNWGKVEFTPDVDMRIPIAGTIQLILVCYTQGTGNETHIKDLNITYLPYINGSLNPVKGDYNFYDQNTKVNKSIDEPVTISDSPRQIPKGALLLGASLLASPQWFRTDYNERLRFTQIMGLIKYTYHYRQYCKIEGTTKGLSLYDQFNNNIPFGFLPQYSLVDLGQPTTRYILTSLDINYYTGQWRGVLVEVQLSQVATFDTYDFSYVF